MARRAPTGIHSEFRERMLVTVRAPVGDSMRSVLMRRLVAEMAERKTSGHLVEWMVGALLDRIAKDVALEQGLQVSSINAMQLDAASQPGEGQGESSSHQVVSMIHNKASQEREVLEPAGSTEPAAPAAVAKKPLPQGLKAMG